MTVGGRTADGTDSTWPTCELSIGPATLPLAGPIPRRVLVSEQRTASNRNAPHLACRSIEWVYHRVSRNEPASLSSDDPLVARAARLVPNDAEAAILVLDLKMRIRGVNAAYEAVSMQRHQDIVGEILFEVFPEDPGDAQASGSTQVRRSIDNALRDRNTDSMPIYRYDIRDPQDPDNFIPRLWTTTHTSVHDETHQYGILEQVTPITTYDGAVVALSSALARGEAISPSEHVHLLSALAFSMRAQHDRVEALTLQADQLFRAIESRDIIGQAKGMIMERYNVDAVRAFELLKKLSQHSNIKLEQVAQQLVDADHPSDPPAN